LLPAGVRAWRAGVKNFSHSCITMPSDRAPISRSRARRSWRSALNSKSDLKRSELTQSTSGVKRTLRKSPRMSAFDPKRTSRCDDVRWLTVSAAKCKMRGGSFPTIRGRHEKTRHVVDRRGVCIGCDCDCRQCPNLGVRRKQPPSADSKGYAV